MDFGVIALLFITLALTAIVACLSVIGFGRIPLAAALVTLSALVVLMISLRLMPGVFADEALTIVARLDRSSLLRAVTVTSLNLAVCGAAVFAIAGTVRVWNHRFRLLETLAVDAEPKPTESAPRPSLKRVQVVIGVLGLMGFPFLVAWELHDFVVHDRGVEYYRDQPVMLLYPVMAAAIVGAILAGLISYGRSSLHRQATLTDPPPTRK